MTRITIVLGALALAVAGAALAAGGPPGGMRPGQMAGGMTGSQAFIRMMVPHHEQAVAMAKLAQDRAEHAQLKTLAASIATTQTKEIAQLRAWHTAWYGTAVPAMAHQGTPLRNASPFDRAFLAAMYRHHQMGVRMIDRFQPSVDRAELTALMKEMRATQSAEMATMAGWYRDWYGAEIGTAPARGTMAGPGACPMHG